MTPFDAIWENARSDLMITTERGDLDVFLWEHSARVAKNARQIAKLAPIKEQSPDELVVVTAGLYHDAAWVARVRNHEVTRYEIHIRQPARDHGEQSALVMKRSLARVLSPESLERAALAVKSVHDRDSDLLEGQIIAEAENLDEVGLLSLWLSIRRGALEGKGVQAVIDTWQKKREYHFWTARLEESFRFDPVRAIARKRLEKFERLMSDLIKQQHGADIMALRAHSRRERTKKPTAS